MLIFSLIGLNQSQRSLFDISRRTALILLLASGRRLHDVTLLEISSVKFISTENSVTFWPQFGSKTNTGNHRQSGWLLTKHKDQRICPVTHVRKLIRFSETRRSTKHIKCLFITVTGKAQPASRTVIAGWLRSIFKEANLETSPGSIRSAVASRGWLDNRPVDEILERGNWKCVKTFKKFYCQDVNRSRNDCDDLLYDKFKTV